MSQEITVTASFSHQNPNAATNVNGSKITLATNTGMTINQTGTRLASGIGQATTSPAAVNIAAIGGGTLGCFFFRNLDPTNNLTILTGTGGVLFATLQPGEACMGRFGSGVTAPFVESSASTVNYQYAIAEA